MGMDCCNISLKCGVIAYESLVQILYRDLSLFINHGTTLQCCHVCMLPLGIDLLYSIKINSAGVGVQRVLICYIPSISTILVLSRTVSMICGDCQIHIILKLGTQWSKKKMSTHNDNDDGQTLVLYNAQPTSVQRTIIKHHFLH
jgi:hypothetical protein